MKHNLPPMPSIEDDIAANNLILQNIQSMELTNLIPRGPLLQPLPAIEKSHDDELVNRRIVHDAGRLTLRNMLRTDPIEADIQDNNMMLFQLDSFLKPAEKQAPVPDKRHKKLFRSLFRLAA